MSTKRSLAPATPSARRWRSASAALALLLAGACTTVSTRTERFPDGTPRPVPDAPEAPATPIPGAPADAEAATVRVGLEVDEESVTLGSTEGLVLEGADGRELARVPAGGRVLFTDAPGGARVDVFSAADVRTRGWGALPLPLAVRPQGDGLLTLGEARYRGAMLIQEARTGLTAVNRLDIETYLLGVVPREIGGVTPAQVEAARAQAVAARTYAIQYLGRRESLGFDVYATVADQVYGGAGAEVAAISDAVRSTAGEILTYGGRPITAYYHSTCAGRTAAIDEVWSSAPVPYLVSVTDVDPAGQAYDRASSRFRWTERWTGDEFLAVLNRTLSDSVGGRTIRDVRGIRILERTPSGRVAAMRISTDAGDAVIGRDRLRWILTPVRGGILNSALIHDVELVRGAGGRLEEVVIQGGGWGHGIGMCQVGAKGRAAAGQDYATILRTYYPGTELRKAY